MQKFKTKLKEIKYKWTLQKTQTKLTVKPEQKSRRKTLKKHELKSTRKNINKSQPISTSALASIQNWPRILLANCMSFCIIVTLLACTAHKLVSSNKFTKNASAAS